MKLKALGALCKREGVFCLYDDVTEDGEIRGQWLGSGDAFYPLTGLPYLSEENLIVMFDISEKQKEKISFRAGRLPKHLSFENSVPGEAMLDREAMVIRYGGYSATPVFTEGGLEFMDADRLDPLADIIDAIEIYERRTDDGEIYFALKLGLLIAAVFMPLDIADEKLVEELEALAFKCRASLRLKAEGARRAEGPEQMRL